MLTCTKDNYEIIEYLLNHKADFKQVNKDGWNAFQIAVREGHERIIEYFLRIEPTLSYSIKTKNGRTPSHTAALHGHLNALKLILKSVNKEKGELMLREKDSCGITPFMDAILADHLSIVKFLIENYKVNVFERDALENSCIHLAAQAGSINSCKYIFDLMFENSTDMMEEFGRCLNKYKMTGLHSACKNNKPEIVRFLLELLIKDDDKNDSKISKLLRQKDIHGRTPLEICLAANFNSCLDILNTISK